MGQEVDGVINDRGVPHSTEAKWDVKKRNVLVLYVVLVSMERCFMSTRCDHNTIIMLSTECAEELRHIILEAEESGVGQREE
jgi:hypothetical protein